LWTCLQKVQKTGVGAASVDAKINKVGGMVIKRDFFFLMWQPVTVKASLPFTPHQTSQLWSVSGKTVKEQAKVIRSAVCATQVMNADIQYQQPIFCAE